MVKIDPGLLKGHGRINDGFYLRVVDGITYMSQMPQKRRRKNNDAQKECIRFRNAVLYAIGTAANPDLQQLYKAKASGFNSAYTMAISDFMKLPVIDSVSCRHYQSHPGDTLSIKVNNIIRVKMFAVAILNADGKHLEAGDAILAGSGSRWVYRAVNWNSTLRRTVLHIKVTDYPGNQVDREIAL